MKIISLASKWQQAQSFRLVRNTLPWNIIISDPMSKRDELIFRTAQLICSWQIFWLSHCQAIAFIPFGICYVAGATSQNIEHNIILWFDPFMIDLFILRWMNEDIHTMFLILFYIYDIIILYFEVQFADGYSVTRECENIWDSTSDSHMYLMT